MERLEAATISAPSPTYVVAGGGDRGPVRSSPRHSTHVRGTALEVSKPAIGSESVVAYGAARHLFLQ
jgi:hypothetical protein